MAISPCNTPEFIGTSPTTTDGIIKSSLDAQLLNYPFFLSLGLTCEDVRPDFDANVAGAWITGNYVASGATFNRPSESDIAGFTWPSIPGPIIGMADSYGFSINVAVTQGGVTVQRGKYNIGYLLQPPACNGGNPESSYSQVITDNLTGTFPIVIGEDDITGVQIFVSDYDGAPPYVGVIDCGTGPTNYFDNITGIIRWPGGTPEIPLTYDVVDAINDAEGLWCCVTEGYPCCVAPTIAGNSFLIPRPENPEPVEENISTPLLNSVLYLSNHSYQFTANYGRIKK